ncbi:MAG: hypothetical protein AB1512_20430 [Thermodesulfobacteriota bacterium]
MNKRLPGLSTLLVMLAAMVWVGCQDSMQKSVPLHLIGVWETSHPRYNGCLLEITAEQIIFQNPTTGLGINFIRGIRTTPAERKTIYDIEYQDREGGHFTLSLYYSRTQEQDLIQFKNQPDLQWRRKGLL